MALNTPRINKTLPFLQTSPARARSPVRDDQTLVLRRVIGTTATSSTGFSQAEAASAFAFIAGCGGVIVALGKDGHTTQRFFHARPSAAPWVTTPSVYDSPTLGAGASQGARQKTSSSRRDSNFGGPLQTLPIRDTFDSPSSGSAVASRTKAASCIALSPDGKLLAIGETGHRPRVLLFPTARNSPRDIPQNALSEHTFGVRCLAFSPDSRYLASLGDINDGFLHIWSLSARNGTAQLKASNKCISSIRQIVWMGNNLVTLGTRHVKVWRLDGGTADSPSDRPNDGSMVFSSPSRTLTGRNCLLGALLDKTFTAAVAISHVQAIVCTDDGDICLLDDNNTVPTFNKIVEAGFSVTAAALQPRQHVLLAGEQGQMKILDITAKTGLLLVESTHTLAEVELQGVSGTRSPTIAMATVDDRLILIDQAKGLRICASCNSRPSSGTSITFDVIRSFPAHPAAARGIRSTPGDGSLSAFMTWSADGTVLFWTCQGTHSKSMTVPLEQLSTSDDEFRNELKTVNSLQESRYIVTGDRLGLFRVLEVSSGTVVYEKKAHANEITAIAVTCPEDDTLIATASRDRSVQLFRWLAGKCEHIQTIDEHTGAVTGVELSADGSLLVSSSSDRTVMVMDAVPKRTEGKGRTLGFLARRAISLRAAPLSVQLVGVDNPTVIISTHDRQIHRYDANSGVLISSFKSADTDGFDAVTLSSIVEIAFDRRSSLIAGVCSSDKSIRLYDTSGRLLQKEYGHTEGMMGIARVTSSEAGTSKSTVATVASDGTIFLWDLVQEGQQLQEALSSLALSDAIGHSSRLLLSQPPLRKVLSSNELSRLHGVREDIESAGLETSTPGRRPLLRHKSSKLSLMHTPKLEPSTPSGSRRKSTFPSSTGTSSTPRQWRSPSIAPRSPSPPGPGEKGHKLRAASRSTPPEQPPSISQTRRRTTSALNSPSTSTTITQSTESLCRSLHAYRKQLSGSSEILTLESVRELERELSLTARTLAEKSARNEATMARILDQISDRLVGLLDEKIEASVARRLGARVVSSVKSQDVHAGMTE